MPTPSQTLHAIRGAANVNAAALETVGSQIPAWRAEVEAWLATPNKGLIRDQLGRVQAAYLEAERQAERLALMATQAIDTLGTGGDPDELPPSVPWSTGELQIAFGVGGRPLAGQELGRYLVVEAIAWDGLVSDAVADVAATAQSDITFSVAGVPIARFRWAAGTIDAGATILVPESQPGDVIVVTAPAVRDATLAGIAGTLVGHRIGA
jgi:hypothetical protein